MIDSILTSIKKLLGINESYEHFDSDIIMHINSVLAILVQLGVGPEAGFSISGKSETWADFLGDNPVNLEGVKTYIYMKVRLIFDPPSTAAAIDSMNRLVNEFEWRLCATADANREATASQNGITRIS